MIPPVLSVQADVTPDPYRFEIKQSKPAISITYPGLQLQLCNTRIYSGLPLTREAVCAGDKIYSMSMLT